MKRSGTLTFAGAAAAAIAIVLSGCTSAAPVADADVRPSPTTPAVATAAPLPTTTAPPPVASQDDEVVPEEPIEYLEADPSHYRTWIGATPENQAPHVVGLDGDHSWIDGVDFVTEDGGIVCSMYEPYYPAEAGASASAIFCTAVNVDPATASCRAISQSPSYGEPFPPNCGYGAAIDLTGASVQTLPAGSSLTWGGLVCIAWRVDAVNCTSNGYQFGGASANGFFSFG